MRNVFLVVFAFLLFGAGFLFGKNSVKEVEIRDNNEVVSDENYIPVTREFSIEATDYAFSLGEIRVRKGDTIKLSFKNKEGSHSFVINEFSVNSGEILEGGAKEIEFIADKGGSFEYYCNIGDHRSQGMNGKLIID